MTLELQTKTSRKQIMNLDRKSETKIPREILEQKIEEFLETKSTINKDEWYATEYMLYEGPLRDFVNWLFLEDTEREARRQLWQKLNEEFGDTTKVCKHPRAVKTAKRDWGHYDLALNTTWVEWNCPDCGAGGKYHENNPDAQR